MDIDNGVYKDYYGYKLYELIENKIRPYGGGNYIYEIEDNKIRQYCGMPVLEFDGHFLRRYCGPIIYEVKDNVIKD
jgi:hypothetical protein